MECENWKMDREILAREMAQMMHWEPDKWVFLEPFIEKVGRAAIEAIQDPSDAIKMAMFDHGQISLDAWRFTIDAILGKR